jgi:hypothetical protein
MDPATREQSRPVTPEANLFPADMPPVTDKLEATEKRQGDAEASRTTLWLHRLSLIIFVIFCIELGMLLTVLPWTRVWTENTLAASHPAWRAMVQDNFVRGVVTGIGLVDIWIGIWEAVHYREGKKKNL